jgi:multiple sugar transport system permease protein
MPPPAVFGFLAPNFIGFVMFTLFPVLFSFVMVFTNWTLKPAVEFEFVGLRNLHDLMGVRALEGGSPSVWFLYVLAAISLIAGLVGALWANVTEWRGAKLGGAVLAGAGGMAILSALIGGGHHSLVLFGTIIVLCGTAAARREDGDWSFGRGTVPGILFAGGALLLWALNGPMWLAYEPRDARFWQFFYNTLYLMIGIPLGIAGSLALAMLLSDRLTFGSVKRRAVGAALCLVCGALTMLFLWAGLWSPNLAFLAGIFWLVAALGMGLGIVAFRTIFYLPQFTAGVALMILWRALYRPETGPVTTLVTGLLRAFGSAAEAPPWLADVTWAKPALMFMGFWIAVGGTNMILYLAALSNVPRDLMDAAEVDGAGRWARFRHVVWPQLAPTTFFISIMSVIGGLQGGFEQARIMTQGGPEGSTTTLAYYIYNKGFMDLDLGYAAAISWVLFAVIFVATAINWKFGKELEVEP